MGHSTPLTDDLALQVADLSKDWVDGRFLPSEVGPVVVLVNVLCHKRW